MESAGASTGVLLEMRGIEKRFLGVPALSDAGLRVAMGEVHALMGQNGAGKSTLIKALTGYVRRDAGEVRFQGQPFEASSPHDAQRKGISTIYQEINLVPQRSVAENICLGRSFSRWGVLDRKAMRLEAERLLAEFHVEIDVRRPLGDFSTAAQQMSAIARAIGFSARLVIMDEPTSSLDAQEIDSLFHVIRKLKEDGVSVIYVSHKLDEIYEVCDRVTVMRDGRTIRSDALSDMDRFDLVSTMLGREFAGTSTDRNGLAMPDAAAGEAARCADDLMLEARELGAGRAVRKVSLNVRHGEIVGMAGLLGAGRTETARVLFGVAPSEAGAMRLQGQDYRPRRAADAIKKGLALCTEDRKTDGIVPEMSVADNIALAILPRLSRAGVRDESAQRELVARLIAQLGIKCSSPQQPVKELSGGNQQKVLLARWLATHPKLLLLDEPTRGIDVGAKGEILRLIRQLAKDGLSVLMISSELDELIESASRIFVLRDGVSVLELGQGETRSARILDAMAHGHARPPGAWQ
jgi:galactofuranose transport system ATP-binding protein